VGAPTTIPFEWSLQCYGIFLGYEFSVSDTEGWVLGSPTERLTVNSSCGDCVAGINAGVIDVLVPAGVPVGSTSAMTIVFKGYGSRTVLLEATAPTHAARSTWGGIKGRFK
jgi:hypothetical protein